MGNKIRLSILALMAVVLCGMTTFGQTLADYKFATGTDANMWKTLSSPTTILSTEGDGTASSVLNIGFTFTFGATNYTQFSVNSDGNLRFGPTATGTGSYTTPFSSSKAAANSPKINFFGCDGYLPSSANGGYVKYQLFGTSPNRVAVVEFSTNTYSQRSSNYNFKWQVQLYERSNRILIIYPSTVPSVLPSVARQVGMCTGANDIILVSASHVMTHYTSGQDASIAASTWPDANRYYLFDPSVIPMELGLTYTGTLGTLGVWKTYTSCTYNEFGEEQVFSFTPQFSSSYIFTATQTSSDPDFFLMSSFGNSGTNVGGGCWGSGTKTVSLTGGTTYYLVADNFKTTETSGYAVSVEVAPATIPYTCSFDTDSESGPWSLANGTQANYWMIGNSTSSSSSNSLYITNDGSSNAYTIKITTTPNAISYVYAYRNLTFASAGDYVVSFKWKGYGESTYDYMRAFLVPVSVETLNAGNDNGITTSNTPTNWIAVDGGSKLNLQSDWQVNSRTVNVSTAGEYNLVFYWKNDNSQGTQPPAAVDDIEVAAPCTATAAINVGSVMTTSAVVTRTSGSGEKYDILVSTSSNPETATESPVEMTSTTKTITGLTPATQYYAYIRSYCSEYRHGAWSNAVSFVTACDKTSTLSAEVQGSSSVLLTRTSGNGVKYDILVSTSSNPASATESPVAMTSATQTVSGLTPATQYYAYIRSYCTQDIYGPWSSAVGFVTACDKTSTLSASVLSSTSVSLTRTSGDGVKYDILVSTSSNPASATESPVAMTSATQTVSGLTPATQYYAYIRSYCTQTIYGAWSSAVGFVTSPACTSVSNLTANAGVSTAEISWSYANDVLRYQLYVSQTAMSASALESASLTEVASSSYSVSGLNSSTSYYVYVRPVCNAYDVGSWTNVQFTTRSVSFSLPYSENFESGTANGWFFNNSSNGWYVGSADANESTYSLYISDNHGVDYEYNNSNVSYSYAYCKLNVEERCLANVSFDWKCYGETTWDVLRVFMIPASINPTLSNDNGMSSSNNTAPYGWIDVSQVGGVLSQEHRWQHSANDAVLLNAGEYYFVLFWKNDGTQGANPPAAVDNISVVVESTCFPVLNVAVTEYDKTSATFSWNTSGDATQWQVLVSTASSAEVATETPVLVNSPSATVSNLQPNTAYNVYVRSYCSESDQSKWSSPVRFTTLPTCRRVEDIIIDSYDDTWVNLSWTNVEEGATQWQVLVSQASYILWATETPVLVNTTSAAITDLVPDTEYYIYVRTYCSESDQSDWVYGTSFYTNPTCKPVENVDVDSYGRTWAVVSWTNIDEDASQWQVLVTTSGDPDYATETPELVNSTMATVNGLTADTEYSVYVRSYCSASDQSEWEYGGDFTTYPPCVQPSHIAAVVTPNMLTITWSHQYDLSNYHVYFSETEISSSELEALTSSEYEDVNSMSYTSSGLTAGHTYHFYVRSVCQGDEFSDWIHYQLTTTTDEILTLPYHQNFEGDVLENWHMSNDYNGWYMGTAVSRSGLKSLYISENNGASNEYNESQTSYSYAYCRLHIDSPLLINVSFDYQADGEGNYDLLRAFMIPASCNPDLSAGESNGMYSSGNTEPYRWIDVGGGVLSRINNWSSSSNDVSLLEIGDYYFVFFWKNDNSAGDNPPAAVDNISIEIVSSCIPIANLECNNVGKTSVDISWEENGVSTQWQVLVTTANNPQSATEQPILVDATNYTITGLEMNTSYNVYVRSYCSESEQSDWSEGRCFTTYPPCVPVENLTATVTPTSMEAFWRHPYNRLLYHVVCSTTTMTDNELNGLDNTQFSYCAGMNFQKDNLTPGTTYHLYVASECADGDISDWVHLEFATPELEAMPLPYHQNFESNVLYNWVIDNQENGWYLGTAAAHESTRSLYVSNDNGATNSYRNSDSYYDYSYAYCRLNVDHPSVVRVQFDWRCRGYRDVHCMRAFLVPVSLSPSLYAGNANGMYSEYGSRVVTPSGWINVTDPVYLSAYYASGADINWQTNIADVNIGESGDYYLVFFWMDTPNDRSNPPAAVDNLSVEYLTECLFYGDVNIDNIGKTSVDISWTTSGPATQFQLIVSEADNIAEATEEPLLISSFSTTVNGLVENTTYYTYIRSYCSENDHSSWEAGPSFTTLPPCEPPYGFTAIINSTSITLSWSQPYEYNSFNVFVSQTEMTDGQLALAAYQNVSDVTCTISELEPGQSYHAYVSSACSASEMSEWVDYVFHTADYDYVTLPYSQDFDADFVENWGFSNDQNGWYIGSATSVSGNSLYISKDEAASNTYDITTRSYSYAYVKFNAETIMGIRVAFDWKCYGENNWDNFRALIVPASVNPNFNSTNGMDANNPYTPSGWYDLSGYLNNTTDWLHFSQTYTVSAAGEYYLVLFWKNDGGSGYDPPAAVDNLSIEILSDENDILAFDFVGAENVVINNENHTITCNVPYSLDLYNVVPSIEISDSATIEPELGTAIDLNDPFVYTVTSESGIEQDWTVIASRNAVLSDAEILSLTFEGMLSLDIDSENATVDATISRMFNIESIAPEFEISYMATINHSYGMSYDFSEPVQFVVTAEDETTKEWTVNVSYGDSPLGADCTNPYIVDAETDLPYGHSSSTAGKYSMFNTYFSDMPSWAIDISGNDVVYRVDVQTRKKLQITANSYGDNFSVFVMNSCGTMYSYMIDSKTNDSHASLLVDCRPGSYYVIVDSNDDDLSYNIQIDLLPFCYAVDGIEVTRFQTELDVAWSSDNVGDNWTLKYGLSGFDVDTEGTAVNVDEPYYEITGLAENTLYDIYVRANCTGSSGNSEWVLLSVSTIATCQAPESIATVALFDDEASLSWQGFNMVQWEFGYKTESETEYTTVVVDESSINLTDLQSSTTYDVRIRSICSNDYSGYTEYTFTTPCLVIKHFPYTEDFGAGIVPPQCWLQERTIVGSGAGLSYSDGAWMTSSASVGDNATPKAMLADTKAGSEHNLASLGLKFVESINGYNVSLDVYRSTLSAAAENEGVEIWVNNHQDIVTGHPQMLGFVSKNYSVTDGVNVGSESAAGWYTYTFNVRDMVGINYVIIVGKSNNAGGVYVDNLTIDKTVDCIQPSNLTVASVGGDNVVLAWSDINAVTGTWNVRYSLNGGDVVEGSVDEPRMIIGGLQPGMDYSISAEIQGVCAVGMESEWYDATINATTDCMPLDLPYSQDFAVADGELPECWRTAGSTQNVWSVSNGEAHLSSGNSQVDAHLLTSQFNFTSDVHYMLEFDVLQSVQNITRPDSLHVLFINDETDTLKSIAIQNASSNGMVRMSLPVPVYEGAARFDFVLSGYRECSIDNLLLRPMSREAEILTFEIDEQTSESIIDSENATVSVFVAEITNYMYFTPTFTISENATVNVQSGVRRNFSEPVEYIVTAEDGVTSKTWTVNVGLDENYCPNPDANDVYFYVYNDSAVMYIYPAYNETSYNLKISSQPIDPEIETADLFDGMIEPNSNHKSVFNGLDIYTYYYIYVQSNCGATGWTEKTACGVFTLPYEQDFSADDCWEIYSSNYDNRTWSIANGEAVYNFSRTNQADDYLVSPVLQILQNAKMEFKYRAGNFSYPETFSVYVGTENNGLVRLDSLTVTNETYQTYGPVDLSDFAGQLVDFAIVCQSDPNMYRLYIDDFRVYVSDYVINVSSVGNGSISPDGRVEVAPGESAEFVIMPDEYNDLLSLMLDGEDVSDDVVDGIYTLADVNAEHTLVATFTERFTFTASAGEGGSIVTEGVTYADRGDTVSFVIIPNEGYRPGDVIVDGIAEQLEQGSYIYTFENVDASHTIHATFDRIIYHTIHVDAGENGIVTPSGDVVVEEGENLTISVIPEEGFIIQEFVVDGVDALEELIANGNNYAFENITADHAVRVSFVENVYYPIAVSFGEHGIITPNGDVSVANGADQTFYIIPDAGYHIESVTVDGEVVPGAVSSGIYTFVNVTAEHSIHAEFAINTYTVVAYAQGGTITPSGSITVNHGDDLTLEFVPDEEYELLNLLVDNMVQEVDGNTYSFDSITSDHAVVAIFIPMNIIRHEITATAGEHGIISPSGRVRVVDGENQTFQIIPDEHYYISSLLVDGEAVDVAESYTFENVIADHTISASFEAYKHTVVAFAGEHGSVTPAGEQVVDEGSDITFTFSPSVGYIVSEVLVDDISVEFSGNSYTLQNVLEDHFVRVNFDLLPMWSITAVSGANGSISPNGTQYVLNGDDIEFIFVPNDGYMLDRVVVDGQGFLPEDNTYRFENVTENHYIYVSFRPLVYFIMATAGPHGELSPLGEVEVEPGATQVFTFNPYIGYEIDSVFVDGEYIVPDGNTYEFVDVATNHTFHVTFRHIAVDIEDEISMKASLYPNPNDGRFMVDFAGISGNVVYQLVNAAGAILVERDVYVDEGMTMEFYHDLKPGVYFARFISGDKVLIERFVVE